MDPVTFWLHLSILSGIQIKDLNYIIALQILYSLDCSNSRSALQELKHMQVEAMALIRRAESWKIMSKQRSVLTH